MAREVVGIIDAGGRGHALAEAYAASPHVDGVVVFPGNDYIKETATKETHVYPKYKTTDLDPMSEAFARHGVTLVDVAQDDAVMAGAADRFRDIYGIPTVGPSKEAGKIEWSKTFSRDLGKELGIRQPESRSFSDISEAEEYIKSLDEQGLALKANFPAEGKGSVITGSLAEAIYKLPELVARFPKAAETFLVEKLATGEEFSTFYASDGETVKMLAHAQDHKREGNGDTGENTGGMGCSTPIRLMTPDIEQSVMVDVNKLMQELADRGTPYQGIGYYGGMWDVIQEILSKIEDNARWGDPEIEVIAPGITSDFYELSMSIVNKSLAKHNFEMDNLARVVVAGASRGYPRNYDAAKDKEIIGLKEASQKKGIRVFGSGIKIVDGRHLVKGGRVFYVVGEGKDTQEAQERANEAMAGIVIEGGNLIYRTDIGWRDVKRLREAGY